MNCRAPLSPPWNGSVSDHSVPAIPGARVTFQCDAGLFPERIMTATCLATGEWDKNPEEIVCRIESSKLVLHYSCASFTSCTQFPVSCLHVHSMECYSTPTVRTLT